jgi:hypothetical protein
MLYCETFGAVVGCCSLYRMTNTISQCTAYPAGVQIIEASWAPYNYAAMCIADDASSTTGALRSGTVVDDDDADDFTLFGASQTTESASSLGSVGTLIFAVRCAFFDRNSHSRMPLDPTHMFA